jgi:type I restriction enzyme R subunit
VPGEYLQQAVAEIAAPKSQDAITENHRIHQYLVSGYPLSYIDTDGIEQNPGSDCSAPTRPTMTGSPSTS